MTQPLGEALIPIFDKLQDVLDQTTLDLKVELPQVVVVGGQSSGKSSVLEALLGRDLIPKGPGICTRRPLIVQFVRSKPHQTNQAQVEEYGEFLHMQEQKFTNFDQIKEEILKETERVAGFGTGISDSPIQLRIHSPLVLTMTLVDLPGITHVSVSDQSSEIESFIKQMIISYIQPSTSIILAVSAANEDLANSDALSTAKEVDPEGIRTIGVVTKLDIMDKDTNAVSVLRNEVVPLQLGYIGIINRSQGDIDDKISIKTARRNEESFFEDNTEYSEVIDCCGVANLRRNLNKVLASYIQRLFPSLRMQISVQIDRKRQEMELYGDTPVLETPLERGALMLSLISRYSHSYSAMIDGKNDSILLDLSGGAKIRDIFQTGFHKSLEDLNWKNEFTDDVIKTTIKNSTGVSGSLLIAQEPFELLLRQSIKTLLRPCIHCKELVEEELMKIARDCVPNEISRFSDLQKSVIGFASEFIQTSGFPAEEMIGNLIECEAESINYDHHDFIGGHNVIAEVLFERRVKPSPAIIQGSDLGTQIHNGVTLGYPEKLMDTSQEPSLQQQGNLQDPMRGDSLSSRSQEDGKKHKRLRHKNARTRRGGLRPGNWLMNIFSRHDSNHEKKDFETSPNSSSSLSLIPPMKRPLSPRSQDFTESLNDTFQHPIDLSVAITRKLVESYMAIVQSNIGDLVPKIIRKFLVNDSKKGLQQYLIGKLYKEHLLQTLIREDPEITMKRDTCSEVLKALKKAMEELVSLPRILVQQGATPNGQTSQLSILYPLKFIP